MGFNDHIDDDDDFAGFLQQIVDMGDLEDTALGITKQVINQGEKSLSEKQEHVFQRYVLDRFTVSKCSRCGSDIPWCEMYDASTKNGMCNYCWHKTEKDD